MQKGYSHAVTEERIARVMAMMRDLTFRRGETAKELAKEWDLHPQRVAEITAEASRRARAEILNPDHVTVTVGQRMEQIVTGGEDRDAVAAGKVWAQLAGAMPDVKVQVTDGTARFGVVAVPELAARLRERLEPAALAELVRLLTGDVKGELPE